MKLDSIIAFVTSDLFASLGGGFLLGSVLMFSGIIDGNAQPAAAVMSVAG